MTRRVLGCAPDEGMKTPAVRTVCLHQVKGSLHDRDRQCGCKGGLVMGGACGWAGEQVVQTALTDQAKERESMWQSQSLV